jgi:hypothetical protein
MSSILIQKVDIITHLSWTFPRTFVENFTLVRVEHPEPKLTVQLRHQQNRKLGGGKSVRVRAPPPLEAGPSVWIAVSGLH